MLSLQLPSQHVIALFVFVPFVLYSCFNDSQRIADLMQHKEPFMYLTVYQKRCLLLGSFVFIGLCSSLLAYYRPFETLTCCLAALQAKRDQHL